MHCTLLLQLMRNFGLGHLISPISAIPSSWASSSNDSPRTPNIRSSLIQTVLATDMSIHAGWMKDFAEFAAMNDESEPVSEADRILVCQALLKCADISNPVSACVCHKSLAADSHRQRTLGAASFHFATVVYRTHHRMVCTSRIGAFPRSSCLCSIKPSSACPSHTNLRTRLSAFVVPARRIMSKPHSYFPIPDRVPRASKGTARVYRLVRRTFIQACCWVCSRARTLFQILLHQPRSVASPARH